MLLPIIMLQALLVLLLLLMRHSLALVTGDCAIIGVGVLGTRLCQQLLLLAERHDAPHQLTGITKSTTRHSELKQLLPGMELLTSDNLNGRKFANVVFCAPPSGFDDYPAAVQDALTRIWDGSGVFCFTSSGAVYAGGSSTVKEQRVVVTETSPIMSASDNPRVARLVQAEEACIKAGGCVLRLAGLYNLERGAHNFWLTSGRVKAPSNGLINLLHYEDAASACLAALQAGSSTMAGRIGLVSDGRPMTREAICRSALQASYYRKFSMPTFEDSSNSADDLGKVYDGSETNQLLQWQPKYESFDSFMKSQAS